MQCEPVPCAPESPAVAQRASIEIGGRPPAVDTHLPTETRAAVPVHHIDGPADLVGAVCVPAGEAVVGAAAAAAEGGRGGQKAVSTATPQCFELGKSGLT